MTPEVICGDALEVMPTLDQAYDAVFLDPPFNAGKDYGEGHDDALDPAIYVSWLENVLGLLPAALNDGG